MFLKSIGKFTDIRIDFLLLKKDGNEKTIAWLVLIIIAVNYATRDCSLGLDYVLNEM